MPQMSNRGSQLFCSLFVVGGLVAVGIGMWLLAKSLRSEKWPVTDGLIQSAEMKSHQGNEGGTTYSADVTYAYQVAGTLYTGDKVSIGQMSSSTEYAWAILYRYPVGKKVSVHYQPGDPADAVLEPGIHGGTWICLGVGTTFTLFGIMFLQIDRAVARAQIPGAPPSRRVGLDRPPVLMGVIFLLVGIGLSFVRPESDKPGWLMYAVGGMFASGGMMLLLHRLENKVYSKVAMWAMLLALLAMFHWLSFGAGERSGIMSTPFSVTHGVNVRTPFAIVTILLDLALVAGLLYSLLPGPLITRNKYRWLLLTSLALVLAISAIFIVLDRSPARHRSLPGQPFVSTPIDDAFWLQLDRRGPDKYRQQLSAAPPALVVRETHYAFNPGNGMGMHYGWLDDRLANLHISFSELVAAAYGMDYTHTEFPREWAHGPLNHCFYDVICTVTNQPQAALRSAAQRFLQQKYGLAWHRETRDTPVLVLRAPDRPLLESKATPDFAHSKSIPELTGELENYFGQPVIDETEATNRYDRMIGDVPSRWVTGRTKDLEANNQFLATVGLELVASTRPQEWLLIDQ